MPNLMEESKLFEWVGIYLGKDQTYQLYKSLIVIFNYLHHYLFLFNPLEIRNFQKC